MSNQSAKSAKYRSRLFAFVALATVPLTVFALAQSYISVPGYISSGSNQYFGSSSSSSSVGGLVLVGQYNGVHSSHESNQWLGSLAVGQFNMIYDPSSLVVGNWNKNTGGEERLIVGNGTSSGPSNALEVFQNGNMNVAGAITCAPGGDIPMYGE